MGRKTAKSRDGAIWKRGRYGIPQYSTDGEQRRSRSIGAHVCRADSNPSPASRASDGRDDIYLLSRVIAPTDGHSLYSQHQRTPRIGRSRREENHRI